SCFVFAKAHLFHAPVELSLFDALERVFRLLLVVDVEIRELLSCVGKRAEDFFWALRRRLRAGPRQSGRRAGRAVIVPGLTHPVTRKSGARRGPRLKAGA